MFKNGGNELFTFPSQYEDSVDLHKGEQMGFVKGVSGFQWAIQYHEDVSVIVIKATTYLRCAELDLSAFILCSLRNIQTFRLPQYLYVDCRLYLK